MKKILLIDDNETDRMLYRRFLGKQLGHERLEISEASSGAEGLTQFQAQRPDCVLLDYHLLDSDGLMILEELKALTPPDTLCVVMITGGGSEALAVRALNAGALDYLVKQHFDQELLNKTVFHAIEKNEWRQYRASYHSQLETVNQQLRDSIEALTEARRQIDQQNTQLTEANQHLARVNADLDNFVYVASHDLRQPVNNLRGLFEELRRSATFQDDDEAVVIRLIDESLHNLNTTITDLAAVVQAERTPGVHITEPIALTDLVADVLQALRPQVQATEAQVQCDFAALLTVPYVRSQLRTIVLNLVSNALKYQHPDRRPQISLRSWTEAGQAVVEIKDNGLGINLERHSKELFQLFRRFHPEASEGSGVGLFLVNRLVQSHDGHIEVESQEGEGTTFRLYLGSEG